MKVFLSHPMHGLTEEQIMSIRDSTYYYLRSMYGNIELIDNYRHEDAPKKCRTFMASRKKYSAIRRSRCYIFLRRLGRRSRLLY